VDFTALKTAALDRIGLPSTDGLASATSLGLAVNYAVQRLGAARAWPWLNSEATAATVAGTATVTIPSSARRVRWVAIEDDVLDRRQRADLIRFSDAAGNGRPNRYALKDSTTLLLSPTPDAIYTVTFGLVIPEPALSSGTDTPLLPSQFHDVIVLYAARYLAMRRKDLTLVAALDAEIKDWMPSLDRAALQDVGITPIRTRQDW
jgi:hypothetical protein